MRQIVFLPILWRKKKIKAQRGENLTNAIGLREEREGYANWGVDNIPQDWYAPFLCHLGPSGASPLLTQTTAASRILLFSVSRDPHLPHKPRKTESTTQLPKSLAHKALSSDHIPSGRDCGHRPGTGPLWACTS